MEEKKRKKKAYKKAKKKFVTLWKTLTIICLIITLLTGILTPVLGMFDNALSVFVGGEFYELVNEDENAVYYASDFETEEAMLAYGSEVCKQLEAEGAVLLTNENYALPLAEGSKVSCFSTSSVNLVYGGTGSAAIDASKAITLKEALMDAGFGVNETLWSFYTEGEASEYHRAEVGLLPTASEICEAPWSVYTDEVKSSIAEYSDAAIVVFSRLGGEQMDLEYQTSNYLALNEEEKEMLSNLCAMKQDGTIKKVIVLLNSSNALQMDFLKEYDIDACLWIGGVGESGIHAIAEILTGDVNPSGRLVDTYTYNNFSAPAMWNFTPNTYEGYEEGIIPASATQYVVYQEGIYVGYRYYETRYEDFVMETGNAGDYHYADTVAFPFGYGLSYTEFSYSDMVVNYNENSDQYEIDITVTNIGDKAGKETVQVYVQSPYTQYDIENSVEKSSVVLCGFDKTKMLEPGDSEKLTIFVNRRDIASYDAYGAGTYILDAGDYYFTVAQNAHSAVNNILAAKGYTVENTNGRMNANGDGALTWKQTLAEMDTTTYAVSENGTEIKNQLSNADPNLYEGSNRKVTWLSRSNWSDTFPTESVKMALTEQMIADLQIEQYNPADYEAMEMPVTGAENGLTLYDMIGKPYDDANWEKLLDQLTFDDMVAMIGDAFHFRPAVESVQAPGARDENGPQGLTTSLLPEGVQATAFTSEDIMAATFNTELMYEVGKVIANNCLMADVVTIYGPGNNIHRTPYSGRNFEYYAEDGYLSGKMSAYEVKAIQERGVDVVIKHFALNDFETDRIGVGVWVNEQAAREIYLKAFQAPFEEGNANGVMVAYTRWGTTWSGANKGLMTGIMRQEWGNKGWSITDNIITDYITGADGVLAGTTAYDSMLPSIVNELKTYENDAIIVNAMREAAHHNLYALANSSGMNGVGENTTVKVVEHYLITICRVVAIIFGVLTIVTGIMWMRGSKKLKATQEYQEYKSMKK